MVTYDTAFTRFVKRRKRWHAKTCFSCRSFDECTVTTPIINQPQAAILGVGRIQKRVVVVENDAIAVRPMAYLSLTFDHRILDGAVAD